MAYGSENQRDASDWREVVGYEGYYEVSSSGEVRRIKGGRGATEGRLLRQKKPNRTNDYCRVQLCRKAVKKTFAIHTLVCEAFHGKRPRGKFANHKDLDKLNNCAANLEWLTHRQNVRHGLKNGKIPGKPMAGHLNGRAKLTQSQVEEVRRQKGKIGQRVIAALCGVSKSAIQFIHQGKHWK